MSVDRAGETESELVERRGLEADERARRHQVEIERIRREGRQVAATVAGAFGAGDYGHGRRGADRHG